MALLAHLNILWHEQDRGQDRVALGLRAFWIWDFTIFGADRVAMPQADPVQNLGVLLDL